VITKLKTSKWRNAHFHHDFRRKNTGLKLEGWALRPQTHAIECHAQTTEMVVGEYPATLLKVFEDAMIRCPSSISIDIDVMEGQPCIAGTRIPVRSILRAIEHYGSVEEAIRCYPDLTADQVRDALFFSQVILEPPRGIDKTSLAS
jgi:uncharacterized protein (DUF433 family)